MGDRLVLVPDEAGQRAEEIPIVDDDLVGVGADRLRHLPRVVQLAERAGLEGDGKGLQRSADHPGHQVPRWRCCRCRPDRKTPSGTSLIRRRRIDSSSSARKRRTSSSRFCDGASSRGRSARPSSAGRRPRRARTSGRVPAAVCGRPGTSSRCRRETACREAPESPLHSASSRDEATLRGWPLISDAKSSRSPQRAQ